MLSNCPLETPVPAKVNEAVGLFEALLTIETVALIAPAAVGLNTTLTGVLWPTAIVAGREGALKEKAWFEIEMLLTIIDPAPVLETVMESVLFLPVVTLPKSRTPPLKAKVPVVVCDCTLADLLELNPWHPTIVARQARIIPTWLIRSRFWPRNFLKLSFIRFVLSSQNVRRFPMATGNTPSLGLKPSGE